MNIETRNEIRIVQISIHLFQSKKKYTCFQIHTTLWIQSRNQSETRNEISENYHEYETQLKDTRESEQNENIEVDKDIAKF